MSNNDTSVSEADKSYLSDEDYKRLNNVNDSSLSLASKRSWVDRAFGKMERGS